MLSSSSSTGSSNRVVVVVVVVWSPEWMLRMTWHNGHDCRSLSVSPLRQSSCTPLIRPRPYGSPTRQLTPIHSWAHSSSRPGEADKVLHKERGRDRQVDASYFHSFHHHFHCYYHNLNCYHYDCNITSFSVSSSILPCLCNQCTPASTLRPSFPSSQALICLPFYPPPRLPSVCLVWAGSEASPPYGVG